MKNFTKIPVLALIAIALTSCLKDELVEDQKYGMINIDEFKIIKTTSASRSFSLLLEDKPTTLDFLTIHLAAAEVAPEDIKVTVSMEKSASLIAAYNTANSASLVQFPADKYSFPEGMEITIPKGSKDGILKLAMNPLSLDASNPYAIGFEIVNIDKAGYNISGNSKTTVVRVSARNSYEGTYAATGYFTHPTPSSSRDIDRTKVLTTINLNTTRMELGDLGSSNYYMYVRVNADNSVTILPDPTAVTADVFSIGENKYDPATKTFTLNYAYNSAAPRRISEVLTLDED